MGASLAERARMPVTTMLCEKNGKGFVMKTSMGGLAVVMMLVGVIEAATLHVPGGYGTIQAAIDDACDGDTVIIAPGVYTGDGNRDIEFRGKAITVRSVDPNDWTIVENTVIDCEGDPCEPHRGFRFGDGEEPNSVLEGVTITNGYGPEEEMFFSWLDKGPTGGGIFCDGTRPTIRRCIITACKAQLWGSRSNV